MKDPTVLLQFAFSSQGLLPVHSSISKMMEMLNEKNMKNMRNVKVFNEHNINNTLHQRKEQDEARGPRK